MDITQATFAVLDVETTGDDPTVDRIVEIACVVTTLDRELTSISMLVNPGIPIPPEASAIHHLTDRDVAGELGLELALGALTSHLTPFGPFAAYVAHNAPFDSAFLPMLQRAPWLDTLRLAKRLRPEARHHGNEVLRYAEGLTGPFIDDTLPHRALHDAAVTAALLRKLLGEIVGSSLWPQDVDALILDITAPMVLRGKVGFGKHKDLLWSEVPKDYLAWMVKQDFDPDALFTARHYLRGGGPEVPYERRLL